MITEKVDAPDKTGRMSAAEAMKDQFITQVTTELIVELKKDESAKANLKQLAEFRPHLIDSEGNKLQVEID